MAGEILIEAEAVRKKFCRSLKRSLWYGVQDMAAELTGGGRKHDQLRKDEFWAVDDVSFELRRGECLGLIGRNGAGKTTLLKMLNGLIKPDHGSITMRGRVGALIALGAGFNPILTGRENIYVNGSVLGLSKKEIDAKLDEIIDFAEIHEFIDAPVQSYSSGMQVRLGFAVAANIQPDVLIVDEVLAVGDLGFRVKCYNKLSKLLKNSAVIIVSHQMNQIAKLCTKGLVLQNGSAVRPASGISDAIDTYNSLFEDETVARRLENGARLEGFEVISGDDRWKSNGKVTRECARVTLEHGAPLTLCTDLLFERETPKFHVRLWFEDSEERWVAQSYSRNCVNPLERRGDGKRRRVQTKIASIPLSKGVYKVGISIETAESGVQLDEAIWRSDRLFELVIVGRHMQGAAPVQLPATFDVKARA